MKRASLLLILLLTCVACSLPAIAAAAKAGGPWREWDAGLREAKASGKPVIVDVYTDWCGWCKRMDRDVYARADVREYLAGKFVPIRLNAEGADPESYAGRKFDSRSLAAHFRVTGYPTTIFLAADGTHLANVPGYLPADRFLLLLRYIGDGHMDRGVSFDDFSKRAGAGR